MAVICKSIRSTAPKFAIRYWDKTMFYPGTFYGGKFPPPEFCSDRPVMLKETRKLATESHPAPAGPGLTILAHIGRNENFLFQALPESNAFSLFESVWNTVHPLVSKSIKLHLKLIFFHSY